MLQKTLHIKQQEYQSTVYLTVPQVKKEGDCFNCQNDKLIFLITRKEGEVYDKKYCWSCSLSSFYELEQGDYEIKNKQQEIKELRAAIYQNDNQLKSELN